MLIPFHEILSQYKPKIGGIVHIGAHECEELNDYVNNGIPHEKIMWFEAQKELVEKTKKLHPKTNIYHAVLSDVDNQSRNFIVTNNYMSSSLLELKEHLKEHPHVYEIKRYPILTITFKTFIEKNKIDLTDYNFLNIDIQGHELAVLKGMGLYLDQFDYIYTEVNTKELYSECSLLDDMDDFLNQHNFQRVNIRMTDHGWGDAFYLKKDEMDSYLFLSYLFMIFLFSFLLMSFFIYSLFIKQESHLMAKEIK